MKFPMILATALLAGQAHAAAPVVVNQLMKAAKVDLTRDVATLPLRLGHLKDGRNVWFVLTDTNDSALATKLGLVHAAELGAAAAAKGTREATIDANGEFTFASGAVDFTPARSLVPGDAPNFFPPKSFTPGSVGDVDYGPLVHITGTNVVYNAPVVAFDVPAEKIAFCGGNVDYSLVHDRVMSICPEKNEVSIQLGHGFAGGEQVIYLSFDSNNELPATMEAATFTPATKDLLAVGAAQTLYAFANGPTGVTNPERQGFNSALSGEGAPLNILDGLTINSRGYTPLWDVNVTVWTQDAITRGLRKRLTNGADVDAAGSLLTNPAGAKVGSLGLMVNCPVVGFVK